LREYLRKVFKPLGGPDGDNDTDDDDYGYDGDRSPRIFTMDMNVGNEGDEEMDGSPTPRTFITPNPMTARPSRTMHTSPTLQNHTDVYSNGYLRPAGNQENLIMDVDPPISPVQPPNGAVYFSSNGSSQLVVHATSSGPYAPTNGTVSGGGGLLNGGSRRPRGFGQQPLIEPPAPTSPVPSDPASDRSAGTTHSHGAGFFRSYHEAVAAASSSRHHVLTPDLNYAEIGHGRGTTDSDDSADSNSTVLAAGGYDMDGLHGMNGELDYVLLDSSNSYLHPMEREAPATWIHNQRQRDSVQDESLSSSFSTEESPGSTQNLLEGVGGPFMNGTSDGRGRTGKRGWRNTFNVAEQYASSFLFGGRGTVGVGGPSNGAAEG